ncbi:hypothetical protein QYF61_003932 [Mycteria americana]|uniref:Uncharacterized protein n=1 Tax=Mycteria americana TaxID=33587 RepID=A0AAN7MHG5_MYCAM|nr:hypothetical protein QYF61_003932 [Mycteria americana]
MDRYGDQRKLNGCKRCNAQRCGLGGERLERCPAGKDPGVLVDSRLKTRRQRGRVAKKVEDILACGCDRPPRSALARPHLERCVRRWVPHDKRDVEGLERVQRRATELGKGLEHKADGERLRDLGLLSLERRRLRGDLIVLHNDLRGGRREVGVGLFSRVTSDRTRGSGLKLRQGRFRLDIGNNFFPKRVVQHWTGLPREAVESPPLEVSKSRVDVALRDVV